jgi:DNA-binding Xre family transcriptional regulator
MAKLCVQEVAQAKDITQSRLQILAEVTPKLLHRYWNNKTSAVDLVALEKIASALGVSPGELITTGEPGKKVGRRGKWYPRRHKGTAPHHAEQEALA